MTLVPIASDATDIAVKQPVILSWIEAVVAFLGWDFTRPADFCLPDWKAAASIGMGALATAYMTTHFLGITTPVWITNGIVIAILLRNPLATWPGLLLVAFIGEFIALMLCSSGIFDSFFGCVSDLVDMVFVALALRPIESEGSMFSNIGNISRFALVNLTVSIPGALCGATLLAWHEACPFVSSLTTWYLSIVFGQLVIIPFLLSWMDSVRMFNISDRAKWEAGFFALLVGVAGCIDFGVKALPGSFLCFPFLLLAAFRGRLLGATSAAVVLTFVATGLTLHGWGPIANGSETGLDAHLMLLQLYLGVILLSSLPVAVMLEHRKMLSAAATLNELSHMARHDVLTGLPNRVLFQERLVWTQAQAYEQGSQTALMMLDLDRFKPVNDLHGHATGDRLLQIAAERIRVTVRGADNVARLGGDEFAIIGQVDSAEAAQVLAQRLITELSKPFEFANMTIEIGCSAGIALSPAASLDNETLMRRADAALYRAKAEGRNCCRFFEAGMEIRIRERAKLEAELQHAVAEDALVPHFQAIVKLDTGKVVGFEMLARWTDPVLGDVSPAMFIPVAETAGLIGTITIQLLRRACIAALQWPDDLFITVNVSPVQLRDRKLAALFQSILDETGLPAHRVEVELTESALIDDFELARAILLDLKAIGIRLALDDFGTGYSSLRHLQGLPLDKIKIDMGFVRSMMVVPASRKIVAGVVALSHSLGLPIVAEGVEDEPIAEALDLMGCDYGQGWLYSRAIPAEKVEAFLAQMAVRHGQTVSAQS